jgi:histidinol-phosphate aminotransferase
MLKAMTGVGYPLARASYRDIPTYAAETTAAVDLSDNTNLWGAPPAALRALREAPGRTPARYPDRGDPELSERLASYLGIEPAMVLAGCGSDNLLDAAIRAFADPGDRLALPDPSFAMIPIFARLNGVGPVLVPLRQGMRDLELDPERLVATGARIIYLCSPNNPTGTVLERAGIEYVVDRAPGVVILDAAYAEFAGTDHASLLRRSDRLLIARTMSKAFGLAGLRIGYVAGSPALRAEVARSLGPYMVSAYAERAAVAALQEDVPWVQARVAEVVTNRTRLSEALTRGGRFTVFASGANFLLARPAPSLPGVRDIARQLRDRGIAVRVLPDLPVVGSALRITIGPWPMLAQLLAAVSEVG